MLMYSRMIAPVGARVALLCAPQFLATLSFVPQA